MRHDKSLPMRMAAAIELLVAVIQEVFDLHLFRDQVVHVHLVALFLTIGFVITEVSAAWHIVIRYRMAPSGR